MIEIGAQLYTVRNLLNDDVIKSTLSKIKEIGYNAVQLYNLGSNDSIENCCEICNELGLKVSGILTDLDWCERNQDFLVSLCEKYKISDIGVSSRVMDYESAMEYIPRANAFGKKVKQKGFTFSYHNHGHEFIKTSCDKTVMDLFLDGFDKNVTLMPDTYWIHDGGYDARHFLEITKGRVEILHLKDVKRTKEGHTFAEIGYGNLYFKGIFEIAKKCEITKFFVEQDECEGNPLDSLCKSYNYIKSVLE